MWGDYKGVKKQMLEGKSLRTKIYIRQQGKKYLPITHIDSQMKKYINFY